MQWLKYNIYELMLHLIRLQIDFFLTAHTIETSNQTSYDFYLKQCWA